MELTLLKVFLPTALAFFVGLIITPVVSHYLYKHKAWKKAAGKGNGYGGGATPIFDRLHRERDTNTPRLGGIVIWSSVFLTVLLLAYLPLIFTSLEGLNFLSRSQTWLPLFALGIGAFVGFIDDLFTIRGNGKHFAGGLPLSQRLVVVGATAALAGLWFYFKLEVDSVSLFDWGEVWLGYWFVPFFVFVAVCVYMSSVIDGLDGLAGGVFLFIFAAYSAIALLQGQNDIAAFCATVAGGILAFLWFNIPPARFYMSETGIVALTLCLTVVAFMTDTLGEGKGVSVLPIVGMLLVVTVITNTAQILSKKLFGRKLLLIAPLHHHFEALGWPAYKVTMRYWVLGFIFAIIGVLLVI